MSSGFDSFTSIGVGGFREHPSYWRCGLDCGDPGSCCPPDNDEGDTPDE